MSPIEEMLKRIQLECRGKQPDQVVELNLDNCRSTGEPEGLTNEYVALQKLSMINVGFTSLKGFPDLTNLLKLELSDNRISGTLACLKGCKELTHLNLSGNKIKSFESLEPLADLTNLISLDLFNNDITKASQYRETVFNLLPTLKYLDELDCNDVEAIDSEDEEASGDEENGHDNGNHNNIDEDDEEDYSDENGELDDEDDKDVDGESNDEVIDVVNAVARDEHDLNVDSDEDELDEEDDSECDDDDDDEEDDEEDDDDEEVTEEYGLAYLNKENIQDDEEDDDDYDDDDEEDEDEEIEDEESDVEASGEPPRGLKRKHEDEEA